jgi:hypothetical protein
MIGVRVRQQERVRPPDAAQALEVWVRIVSIVPYAGVDEHPHTVDVQQVGAGADFIAAAQGKKVVVTHRVLPKS